DESRTALAAAEKEVERARQVTHEHRAAAHQLGQRAYAVLSRRSQLDSRRAKYETEGQNLASQAERMTRRLDAIAVESSAFGDRGVLAEMIETDVADAAVVESGLGAFATAVVVGTFEDAERAARFVEERKLGRCTFLALDSVVPAGAPVSGGVASLVRCAPEL